MIDLTATNDLLAALWGASWQTANEFNESQQEEGRAAAEEWANEAPGRGIRQDFNTRTITTIDGGRNHWVTRLGTKIVSLRLHDRRGAEFGIYEPVIIEDTSPCTIAGGTPTWAVVVNSSKAAWASRRTRRVLSGLDLAPEVRQRLTTLCHNLRLGDSNAMAKAVLDEVRAYELSGIKTTPRREIVEA